MKNRVIFIKIFLILSLILFFANCKSVPVKREIADFCGFVIDENNNPVKNFLISVQTSDLQIKKAITNDGGIFVINNIKLGNLKIEGKKEGFSKYLNENIEFYDRTKILCIKISSADFVLENFHSNIKAKNFESAQKNLESIFCEESNNLKKVILEYEKFLKEKQSSMEV